MASLQGSTPGFTPNILGLQGSKEHVVNGQCSHTCDMIYGNIRVSLIFERCNLDGVLRYVVKTTTTTTTKLARCHWGHWHRFTDYMFPVLNNNTQFEGCIVTLNNQFEGCIYVSVPTN